MAEEFSEKELERLATAMLMYLFSYEKRNCNCNECETDKQFSEDLLNKITKLLEDY